MSHLMAYATFFSISGWLCNLCLVVILHIINITGTVTDDEKEHKIQWVPRMHLLFVFYCLVWMWFGLDGVLIFIYLF